MKRRASECPKLRRPIRKNKFSDSVSNSTFVYIKFLLVWAMIILADYILEFRFEYLWPFWLLIRSIYDSFKYQGLAFSCFFISLAITSDVVCLLCIPLQWLFFVASTYVWVQLIWQTVLAIQWSRLALGSKATYLFRIRQKKQKKIIRENELYWQILQSALPFDVVKRKLNEAYCNEAITSPSSPTSNSASVQSCVSNGGSNLLLPSLLSLPNHHQQKPSKSYLPFTSQGLNPSEFEDLLNNGSALANKSSASSNSSKGNPQSSLSSFLAAPTSTAPSHTSKKSSKSSHSASFSAAGGAFTNSAVSSTTTTVAATSSIHGKDCDVTPSSANKPVLSVGNVSSATSPNPEVSVSLINRLQIELKKFKADLQTSKQVEQDLRNQIDKISAFEKSQKAQLKTVKADFEIQQTKIQNLMSARQQDKQTVITLEKKILEEQKLRAKAEALLSDKNSSAKSNLVNGTKDSSNSVNHAIQSNPKNNECSSEACKIKRRELENENKAYKRQVKAREEKFVQKEIELNNMRKSKNQPNDTELLITALSALKNKNIHLESSLSSETKLKLELFTALSEANRCIELSQDYLAQKDHEIEDLKSKIAEVLAIMPSAMQRGSPSHVISSSSSHNVVSFPNCSAIANKMENNITSLKSSNNSDHHASSTNSPINMNNHAPFHPHFHYPQQHQHSFSPHAHQQQYHRHQNLQSPLFFHQSAVTSSSPPYSAFNKNDADITSVHNFLSSTAPQFTSSFPSPASSLLSTSINSVRDEQSLHQHTSDDYISAILNQSSITSNGLHQ